MPTYQYSCTECGHFFEQVQSFSDASLTECPACQGKLRKVFNAVGVVFKGSGFYRTDSRSENGAKTRRAPAAPAPPRTARSRAAARTAAARQRRQQGQQRRRQRQREERAARARAPPEAPPRAPPARRRAAAPPDGRRGWHNDGRARHDRRRRARPPPLVPALPPGPGLRLLRARPDPDPGRPRGRRRRARCAAPSPRPTARSTLPGLRSEVRVVRDELGVPQVYADNSADLFFAQGFVQAQDRFFEMDVRRHITAGRLSEMFGPDALETDKVVRTLGWRRVAEQEVAELDPEAIAYLEAFSAGVNAYLADRSPDDLSLEYTVLGARRPRLPGRGLDAGRLGRLAQGDGVGPARQHAGRDRPGDGLDPADRGADRRALPAVPLHPQRAGRSAAARWSGAASTPAPATSPRSARARRVPPGPVVEELLAGVRARSRRSRPRVGTGDGRRQQRLGRSTATTPRPVRRSWPTTRTWPPPCRASGTRWACTAPSSAPTAPSTSRGFTFAGFPGVIIGHNQRVVLGLHQPRARRQRPLPRGRRGRALPARQEVEAVRPPHRDDPDRRRGALHLHRPQLGARTRCSPTSTP